MHGTYYSDKCIITQQGTKTQCQETFVSFIRLVLITDFFFCSEINQHLSYCGDRYGKNKYNALCDLAEAGIFVTHFTK